MFRRTWKHRSKFQGTTYRYHLCSRVVQLPTCSQCSPSPTTVYSITVVVRWCGNSRRRRTCCSSGSRHDVSIPFQSRDAYSKSSCRRLRSGIARSGTVTLKFEWRRLSAACLPNSFRRPIWQAAFTILGRDQADCGSFTQYRCMRQKPSYNEDQYLCSPPF
jgi:hypothetical protein